jgi:hypothetical protein
MMLLMQTELDQQPVEEQEEFAQVALRSLVTHLHGLSSDERQLTMVTHFAIIDDASKEGMHAVVKDVGISGILDDVHCISLRSQLPGYQYSLGLDVISLFPPHDPKDSDLVMSAGFAPISKVSFIETAA